MSVTEPKKSLESPVLSARRKVLPPISLGRKDSKTSVLSRKDSGIDLHGTQDQLKGESFTFVLIISFSFTLWFNFSQQQNVKVTMMYF